MANLYRVATGNWNATNSWSNIGSGGVGNVTTPGTGDNCFFDVNTPVGTVTINTTANCANLDFTGRTGTWAGSSAMSVYGNLTLASGITRTYTGTITFRSTTTGKTIDTVGKTLGGGITFDGTGGGWTLLSNLNIGTATITLSRGTFNTGGYTVDCGTFTGNAANVRGLNISNSTINVTSGQFNLGTNANLTFSQSGSTINLTGGTNQNFDGNGNTFGTVILGATTLCTITGNNTFTTLTRTGGALKTSVLTLGGNQTVSGTLTINGNSSTNRILVNSNVPGTSRTISAGTVVVSNADFQDINGAGAGSWDLSAVSGLAGDVGGNTNITFLPSEDIYLKMSSNLSWSNTGIWFTTSGGSTPSRVPLAHDNVYIDANSITGTRILTSDMSRIGKNIDFTGCTNLTFATASQDSTVTGNLTFPSSGLTITGTNGIFNMQGRGTTTLTTGGINIQAGLTVNTGTGTLLIDGELKLTMNNSGLSLLSGTLNTQNNDVTITNTFANNGGLTRSLICGSSTITINSAGVPINSNNVGFTLDAGTSTFKITNTGTITLALGTLTYYNLWLDRGTATTVVTISGSNTFNQFKDTGTMAHTIKFTAGTTQTIEDWQVTGNPGQLITIDSTTTGVHYLVKTGTGVVDSDYLNIQHSVATPSSTWYAGVNSVNNQGVATAGSGWIFTAPPSLTNSNFFMFFQG